MNLFVRPIRQSELPLLEDLLYEAIWQPDAASRLPREVIRRPELMAYVEAFGARGIAAWRRRWMEGWPERPGAA